MGQKVNPIGYRIGVNKDWDSRWYADKDYSQKLLKDIKIREYIEKNLKDAAISKVIIERKKDRCELTLTTAKPGVIIGRGGEDIEKLRKKISKLVKEDVYINIVEEKNPLLSSSHRFKADEPTLYNYNQSQHKQRINGYSIVPITF